MDLVEGSHGWVTKHPKHPALVLGHLLRVVAGGRREVEAGKRAARDPTFAGSEAVGGLEEGRGYHASSLTPS